MLKPTLAMVDMLTVFPFHKEKLLGYKHELPLYLSTSVDLAESIGCLEWWKIHATEYLCGRMVLSQYYYCSPCLLHLKEYFDFLA